MAKYRINQFEFDDELGTLVCDGNTIELDPKISALLSLFAQNPGQVFSRDELLDRVWQGSIVNDNTINWSISQLRKALSDDPKDPQFIQTISKRGYRLVADVRQLQQQTSSQEPTTASKAKATAKTPYKLIAAVIALGVLSIFAWYWYSPTTATSTKVTSTSPLTNLPGQEKSGDISEDGLLLVFLHRPEGAANFQPYLQPLKENLRFAETTATGQKETATVNSSRSVNAFPLIQDGYDYLQIMWGHDPYHLLTVRRRNEKCEVVAIALNLDRHTLSQERLLRQCHASGFTRIAMDKKQQQLYFTDRAQDTSPYSLFSYDLNSDQIALLQTPDIEGPGYRFIDFNAATQQLLLLQNNYWRETSFVEMSPASGEVRELFNLESVYFSAYWGAKPHTLWLNWGNDMVLEYNTNNQTSHMLLQSSFGWNHDFRPVSSNKAIFVVTDSNPTDLTIWQAGNVKKLTTPFAESYPTFSPKTGRLAFVSNRSGLPQIWLQEPGQKQAQQLSDSKEYMEVHDISWSVDETSLVGVSKDSVGLLAFAQQNYKVLVNNGSKPFFPALSPQQSTVAVSHVKDEKWHINLYPVHDEMPASEPVATIVDGFQAQFQTESTVLFTHFKKPGIWTYDVALSKQEQLWQEFPADAHWQLDGDNLVYSSKGAIFKVTVSALRQDVFKPEKLLALPETATGEFSFNANNQQIVFVERPRSESNLKLASIE